MEARMNGNEPAEGLTLQQAAADPQAVAKAQTLVDAAVRQVLGVVLRGLMVSTPGIGPEVLARSAAKQVGIILAESMTAELDQMLKLRKQLKDAFDEGVKEAKIKVPQATPGRLVRA